MQRMNNSDILAEVNWLSSATENEFDRYIDASNGKIKSYQDLARYKIYDQVYANNYDGLTNLAANYAEVFNDPAKRQQVILDYIGFLLKPSAMVRNEDDVMTIFKRFAAEEKFPGADTAEDFVSQNAAFLRTVKPNPSQFVLSTYPKIILAKLIAGVVKRYGIDSKVGKSATTYETIVRDFENATSLGLQAAERLRTGRESSWSSALGRAKRDQPYVPSPAKFQVVEPTRDLEGEEEEFVEPTRAAGEPPSMVGEEEPTEPGAPPKRRERKFKGTFAPGAMNLVYAMGDFWERVKEVEGDPMYAVEVLQAAAEKLGRPGDLTNLFAAAAAKLDEELPEETPTTS